MDWLSEVFLSPSVMQTVILISIVAVCGLQLGKFKIKNISLGITFVFFVGILIGNLHIEINRDMLSFAQNFGLILFVYALGLQVGPGFFSSLKKGGVKLNMLSLALVIVGTVFAVSLHYITGISLSNMMGLLAGAVTNTPALGAAQEALKQVSPSDGKAVADMALACAVAYPLGVVGVILAIIVIRKFTAPAEYIKPIKGGDASTYIGEFQITNPAVANKTIKDIMKHSSKKFVISRIWHDGKVLIPTSDTTLQLGDHLLVISIKSDVENIKILFGEQEAVDWNKEDIDWNHIDNSHLVSKRILVTKSKVNGAKLETLKLRNLYGINITRVTRAGIDLLAAPGLALQIGDRLTVVGEAASINNVAKILGDEVKRLKEPNLIAVFLGIALGLILGALPIPFPGMEMPVRLGLAGGPIIVGILMGAFGPRFKITIYTTPSSNMMLRELGLVIYLACLGIDAGEHFFETVFQSDGLLWIGIGFAITVVPVLIVGLLAMKIYKLNYGKSVGMICGGMANPIALNYANSTIESDDPSVAYATVYPLSMFARIIIAQLILMFLL